MITSSYFSYSAINIYTFEAYIIIRDIGIDSKGGAL